MPGWVRVVAGTDSAVVTAVAGVLVGRPWSMVYAYRSFFAVAILLHF
jgi:hypothetical protein